MNRYLDVKRIEFSVTNRCNAHCQHCHVAEGKRHALPEAIDRDLAVGIVRKVSHAYEPSSIMTFGGEPLLYLDVVCAIHRAAAEGGIPHRSVITNGGVPRSPARAEDAARRLADSGVNAIYISVDAFHQEHIPLEVVRRNAAAYAGAGIARLVWNPCWVVSAEEDNPYNRRTREVLDALADLTVERDEGNVVQPDGNAQQSLEAYMPPRIALPAGSCEDVPYGGRLDEVSCIGIEPDGGVSICWDWVIGNTGERDILDILSAYSPDSIPEAEALLKGGVGALAELYRGRGVRVDPAGYYSICDMCRCLRGSAS